MNCTRCGERPRWRAGIWCARCITSVCCIPWRRKGRMCTTHRGAAMKAAR